MMIGIPGVNAPSSLQAIRVGTSRLAALGLKYCAHGIGADQSPAQDAKTPSASGALNTTQTSTLRLESNLDKLSEETVATPACVPSAEVCSQLIGAAILELGVIFHRYMRIFFLIHTE